jgi:hypothetical protein
MVDPVDLVGVPETRRERSASCSRYNR